MKLAILMTCHNRKNKTLQCLEHLYNQISIENIDFDVFLVDDGSTDGTSVAIKKQFPKVYIIKGNGKLYWNRGMYLAWITALKTPDWDAVLWLNDDTVLISGALQRLVDYAKMYRGSIIVGSVCSFEDRNIYTYGGYQEKNVIIRPIDKAIPCNFFNGNIVLVPMEVSDKIGILDYKYRHAVGDFEYGIRANKNGINCYAIPDIGRCDRNGNYVKWMDRKYNVFTRLKLLYSPLGNNPFEAFYYYKNISLKKAFKVFVYVHLKTIWPTLFQRKNTYLNSRK